MSKQIKKLTGQQLILGIVGITLLYLLVLKFFNPTIVPSSTENKESTQQGTELVQSDPPTEKEIKTFKSHLDQLMSESEGNASLTVLNESGETIYSLNPETTYQMAHTFNPLFAYSALNNIEEADASYFTDDKVTIKNQIQSLIEKGDEEAAANLFNQIGYEAILKDIQEIGLDSFDLDTEEGDQIRINSQDLADFYFALNSGDLLNIKQTDFTMDLLSNSHEHFSSSTYLPEQTELFHQDGESSGGHHHDAGIIRVNNRSYYYALLTYDQSGSSTEKDELLKKIRLSIVNDL